MKNYVVWTNCDVIAEDNNVQRELNIKPCDNPKDRASYNDMHRVSRATAEKFLNGNWEAIVWTDPAPSRLDIFKRNWQRIWDLWHREPCNILYLDSDTMFVRPTEIFERFLEFRMFNWTDPKSTDQFENFYNAGVRYYPSTINAKTWSIGQQLAQNWNDNNWNMEQDIFNAMFWQQDIVDNDHHHPELNWQGMKMIVNSPQAQATHEKWNQCPLDQAHILHIHGSRNAVQTAKLMVNTAKQLGIEI